MPRLISSPHPTLHFYSCQRLAASNRRPLPRPRPRQWRFGRPSTVLLARPWPARRPGHRRSGAGSLRTSVGHVVLHPKLWLGLPPERGTLPPTGPKCGAIRTLAAVPSSRLDARLRPKPQAASGARRPSPVKVQLAAAGKPASCKLKGCSAPRTQCAVAERPCPF